ncbi:DUF4399 domain-containing protein [Thiocapsa roseopersicina]|uniref:DUF4399 domain-containing protein n=1 Tax=Thiocapsa roseopersicina TaxID=1058 RepID=A0A1H2SQU9_THIRO|nr:DUF4399 domain-containing protein [Thiocapsa roseopersicina]SDW33980.1 protein of unknown function [Thiocapsa roseopersicina]
MKTKKISRLPVTALLIAAGLTLGAPGAVGAVERTPAPEDARAYIITPEDGSTVPQTFVVRFGLTGMGVAPAGADLPKTGHHHLLVDMDSLPPLDQPISADILHFGGGQTETQVTLPPGEHTLQIILGDKNHIPHDPPIISERITVTVE